MEVTIVLNIDDSSHEKSLDAVVQKLDQDSQSSQSWGKSVWSDPEKWDELKKNIQHIGLRKA